MKQGKRVPQSFQKRPLSAVDLFAGAGGLSAGLEQAGFETTCAVDKDSDAIATLRATQAARVPVLNNPDRTYLNSAEIICADIAGISASDLRPTGSPRSWRPDLLAGGPPCQPFSSAGRRAGLDDPRGTLFLEFVRIASELRPRLILFENVRGLLTQKDQTGRPGGVLELVQQSFEDIGYAVRFAILNAADFGAAQRRVRLYMIGSADHALPEFPAATHSRLDPADSGLKPWVTLGEFLSAQPAPDPADVVRPRGRRADELGALRPGTGLKSGGVIEHQRPSGHWGYKQDSFLADPSLPARTIRAAATPDWIRLEDETLRRLTWPECAALQGFPAGWQFVGKTSSKFRQIGNAVCVPMGAVLAEVIAGSLLAGRTRTPANSPPWPDEFKKRVNYTAMENRVNGPSRALKRRRT